MNRNNVTTTSVLLFGLVVYLFMPTYTYAARGSAPSLSPKDLKCYASNGERYKIVPMQIKEEPFKDITKDRVQTIAYDKWHLNRIIRPVGLFEFSRFCIGLNNSRSNLSESDKDCKGIQQLRKQNEIKYRELHEIVEFYSRWKDIRRKKSGDPRRAKKLFNCYKNYRPVRPIRPPSIKLR